MVSGQAIGATARGASVRAPGVVVFLLAVGTGAVSVQTSVKGEEISQEVSAKATHAAANVLATRT